MAFYVKLKFEDLCSEIIFTRNVKSVDTVFSISSTLLVVFTPQLFYLQICSISTVTSRNLPLGSNVIFGFYWWVAGYLYFSKSFYSRYAECAMNTITKRSRILPEESLFIRCCTIAKMYSSPRIRWPRKEQLIWESSDISTNKRHFGK